MKNEDIKKEFSSFCWGISKVNNKWIFWWDLLEKHKDNENYNLYKQKMNKLLDLLNEDDSKLLNMDIENEIYDLI